MTMSFYYSGVGRDIGDLDNDTGNHPGYLIEVGENDGLVVLCVRPANQPDTGSLEGVYGAVFNPDEAERLINGMRNAVDAAVAKGNLRHPNRVRES